MQKIIEIPDGKLCCLIKKDIEQFRCPCLREEGAPSGYYCGLYNKYLGGTENSVRKCDTCKMEEC